MAADFLITLLLHLKKHKTIHLLVNRHLLNLQKMLSISIIAKISKNQHICISREKYDSKPRDNNSK